MIYGAIFSKSLIQFSLDQCGCVQALLFKLRSNYGMGNESNWDRHQKDLSKHSCIQCPSPYCIPFLDHASARHSWTHKKVWLCLLWEHCSYSWLLVPTRFCLCPPIVCFCPLKVLWSNPTVLQSQIPCEFSVPLRDPQVEKSVVVLKLTYLYRNLLRIIVLQFVDCVVGHFLVCWNVTSSETACYKLCE